jgi:hypothetical protein
MTRAAICEFGQSGWIIRKSRSMTIQTPTHIHDLRILGNFHLCHIAMTGFAIQTCSNVRTVHKVDKIRHLRNRHPGDILVIQNIIFENCQLGTSIGLGDLLMAAPAFGKSG